MTPGTSYSTELPNTSQVSSMTVRVPGMTAQNEAVHPSTGNGWPSFSMEALRTVVPVSPRRRCTVRGRDSVLGALSISRVMST